jgi:hypothetical protein
VRPRRSGSASCPASPAPRAARQGQAPARTAGFPAIPASLGCPRMVPVSNGECISTACASVAQEPTGIHIEFFSIHMFAHRIMAVIRTFQRLSTALCTNHPQPPAITRGKPRTSSSGLSGRRGGPGRRGGSGRRGGPGRRRGPGDVPVPRAPATAMSPRVRNAAVNTIALSRETTYHEYMTTWQPQKRDGHMNPISQLEAALIGGVVAV